MSLHKQQSQVKGRSEGAEAGSPSVHQIISAIAQADLGGWGRHLVGLADPSPSAGTGAASEPLERFSVASGSTSSRGYCLPRVTANRLYRHGRHSLIAAVCFPLHLFPASSQEGWADCKMVYFGLEKCDSLYSLFLSGGNAMPSLT